MDFDKNVALALAQSEDAINRLQIDKALLSTSDLAKDEF
ncbi:putative curli assembly protein CsgE [Enterobacter roggenkampii]|jgi:curli production assembly/transport component CsgE|nr:putative curli assembly protein CsgE [Enterobacter roggenkampii]QLC82272.1 curli assembly protein CsgE [Enterobacter roggenkampii]